MFTRVRMLAAVAGLLGLAGPALAFHHCGCYHLHYRAHGPVGAAPVVTGGTPGLVTHGIVTQGLVAPGFVTQGIVTQGLVTQGLVSPGVVTNGLVTQGLVTQGTGAPQGTMASAQDIAQLKASIDSLKAEVIRLRQTNDRIYAEVQAIRKGMKFPDPPAAGTGTGTGTGGVNPKGDLKDFDTRAPLRPADSGVDLAALRRQVEQRQAAANTGGGVDLSALRRQVEERQAAQAARPASPPTVVANAR